jgi:hypothetical protein
MLIAHEFGHFIDVSKRPSGYSGGLKDKEEFFADSIGAQMSLNAGYEDSMIEYSHYLLKHANLLKSRGIALIGQRRGRMSNQKAVKTKNSEIQAIKTTDRNNSTSPILTILPNAREI